VTLCVQIRVGVCEWLAWLLRMRREPEVAAATMTSRRRSSLIGRRSTHDDELVASSYSMHAGHPAAETNGDWLQRQKSAGLPCRRGSIRMARRSSSRVEHRIVDSDVAAWRGLQSTRADVEPDDEASRTSRLLSSILDELRQLTGKVERDEARQDEIND